MLVLNYKVKSFYETAKQIFIDALEKNPNVINIFIEEEFFIPNLYHYFPAAATEVFKNKNIQVNYLFGGVTDLSWYTDESIPENYYHIPEHNINVHLWPEIFFKKVYCYGKLGVFFDVTQRSFKYPLMCLNGRRRLHRCELMDILARENMIVGNAITWHNIGRQIPYHWNYWNEQKLTLTETEYSKKDPLGFNELCLPEEWADSFLHLVPETEIDVSFISEKTTMCLLSGAFFVVYGNVNYHQTLKSLGFELYDEIIDYSFDFVENQTARLEMLVAEVKRIINTKDYEEMYNLIKPKLERNKDLAISIAIDPSRPKIIDQYGINFYDQYKCSKDGSLLYPFKL
jgi:hypothetical protein